MCGRFCGSLCEYFLCVVIFRVVFFVVFVVAFVVVCVVIFVLVFVVCTHTNSYFKTQPAKRSIEWKSITCLVRCIFEKKLLD